MKQLLGFVLLGLLTGACSQPGENGNDLGLPQDLLVTQNMSDAAVGTPALSVLAGGLGGAGNVDGTGAAARFAQPSGVAVDGTGTVYVADAANHTIRKVVISSGVVTTLAGSAGLAGNGNGTGAAARFNGPQGVAVDSAGNLFVADSSNHTIRKVVVSTGVTTTLAGMAGITGSLDSTGTAARFNNPQGVALDGAGNLFVADSANHTIRKVVIASGMVTTLAGMASMAGSLDSTGTAARFNNPQGVALDGAGNLFVAEFGNHTIRKVVIASGVVTTLAGTAGMVGNLDGTGTAARFNGPRGVAVDGADTLLVADGGSSTIRKVVISSGVVSTLAGVAGMVGSADGTGAAARFFQPFGVALDGAGNLLVADTGNQMIRKVVLLDGMTTSLAGAARLLGNTDGAGAAARFFQPFGVALDGAGNLFVGDSSNHTIRKVVVQGGGVTKLAGTTGMAGSLDGTGIAARFNNPDALALDGAGNLFVADAANHTIRKVVIASGVVTTLAGAAGMQGSTDGTGNAARFYLPQGVATDGADNLYVADTLNYTIRKVVIASGVVTTLAGAAGIPGSADGTGTAARFNRSSGLALDGAGNLYVAEFGSHTIRKVVIASGATTTLAGVAGMPGSTDGTGIAARFNNPQGLTLDGAGNLYVADSGNRTIRKIELASANVTTVVGVVGRRGVQPGPLPASLNLPVGIAVSPTGVLYLADANENAILEVR